MNDLMQAKNKLKVYLENDPLLQKVYTYTKERFNNVAHLTAHNWEHIYRDIINSIVIGEAEGADMSIVLVAMVLHDIGFLYGAIGKNHGAIGAEKLHEYLQEGNIELPEDVERVIASCILTHKGSMHDEKLESLEAKVVADSDMLEKFGAFGVYQGGIRTYTEFNYPIEKVIARGETLAGLALQTKTGEELAAPGREFVAAFYKQLKEANKPYEQE